MTTTQKEALEKWCPFTQKHCKGLDCMLFEYSGKEIRWKEDVSKGETVREVSDEAVEIDTYKCSMANVPMITVGNVSVPANIAEDKHDIKVESTKENENENSDSKE